jgi:hypothetical protein
VGIGGPQKSAVVLVGVALKAALRRSLTVPD